MINTLNTTPAINVNKATLRAFRKFLVNMPTRPPIVRDRINAYQIILLAFLMRSAAGDDPYYRHITDMIAKCYFNAVNQDTSINPESI